jgi:hypothetical protein
MDDYPEQPQKPKNKPITLLFAQVLALVFVFVFGGLYSVPRLFSIESFIGPPAGIALGFAVILGCVALVSQIFKTLQRVFEY